MSKDIFKETTKYVGTMIHRASAEKSPESIINQVLGYLGEQLGADRAYIFEDNKDGTMSNTYEWCRQGVESELEVLKNIPIDSNLENWIDTFREDKSIVISDLESIRYSDPPTYESLTMQGVDTVVAKGIKIGNEVVAFYGIDNPPVEQMADAEIVLGSMDFVLSMMLSVRNHAKQLERRSSTDTLTGCRNRKALKWIYTGDYEKADSVTVLMCDLNGLKKKNDKEGHAAGDIFICDAAEILAVAFGKNNVYRVGGDEFIVVKRGLTEEEYNKKIAKVKEDCIKKNVSMSVGSEYHPHFDVEFDVMLRAADDKMYDEKRAYYATLDESETIFTGGRLLMEDVLKELSESFDSIFYVDFDKNVVYPYRLSESIKDDFGQLFLTKPTFEEAMEAYINNYVVESDKRVMNRITKISYIKEHLANKRAFSQQHRIRVGEDDVYYRVKFSNMTGPGDLHHVVMGFTNVNSEIRINSDSNVKRTHILIVEDNLLNRTVLKDILSDEFRVYEASDGNEALDILRDHHEEICLVLTDLEMPSMDGFTLITKMKEEELYQKIPIIVTTAHGDDANKNKCLALGANDFVSKPYNEMVMLNRIRATVRLSDITATLNTIETDALTGLYTKEAFYKYAQEIVDSNPDIDFVIVVSDIKGFKAINEQYGKEMGDAVLKYVAGKGENSEAGFLLGGRIGGDVFACIKPDEPLSAEEEARIVATVQDNAPVQNLILKYGYYYTKDGRDLTIQQMCDRADMALNSIKDSYGKISAVYNDSMRQKLLMNQQIIDSMEGALSEEQFCVYFQPKFDINSNRLAGAEALVRWNHPQRGFMSPGIFIPLFEQNGFIAKLDRYVWRKSCEELHYWIKQGKPFPISVNISRKDFVDPTLAAYIIEMVDSYKIPHELLHVEVTESAYSDNPEDLKNTVSTLHNAGFVIELDDFGTGYSSLTALNSMDLDIIKLDMSIIKNDNRNSGKSVLEFSMQLAKMMNLKTIQEGVETKEQLERIKELGGDYVQGFYYSKPLSHDQLVEYVEGLSN